MKKLSALLAVFIMCLATNVYSKNSESARQTIDFNFDWQFHLGDAEGAFFSDGKDDHDWQTVRVPHDWSVGLPYSKENTASSTGFKTGGIGWYRKVFTLSKDDLNKTMWLEFDGIYNNSKIWINGRFAAERPNGYSSFAVNVSDYAVEGENLVAVKVDRTAYNDARWYTGSGIYRSVRFVKTDANHIGHWGVQVLTPEVSDKKATVKVSTTVNLSAANKDRLYLDIRLLDQQGKVVSKSLEKIPANSNKTISHELTVKRPKLWSLDHPNLYTALVTLRTKKMVLDNTESVFGIRNIEFTADKGFLLNGKATVFKGVNLHHDAGAVGAAVPKEIWRYRLEKLQSVGVNALRMAHNPHSSELLDLADEMGLLVISEMFDDWLRAKDKSVVYLSDNAGKGASVDSYTNHFAQWAEKDLTDLIRRDFNHPSVIMWSIGNEIEWTYPYYNVSHIWDDEEKEYHGVKPPVYDRERIREKFEKNKGPGVDHLVRTAKYLSDIVKKLDLSRPVTAGLVTPSVDFATGYTDALDVVGYNYRSQEYDIAHKTYPEKPIYGSENWGTWPEWRAALERDFIPGIFIWTGFAYKGEAGPWPRKGLEISLFDYAGNKTPRGHQFEGFWLDKPKVYLATTEAARSEYQYDKTKGWVFTERKHPIPQMQWVRAWDWYDVDDNWNYQPKQDVIVHVYSNTDESELLVNGKSLGKQTISDDNNRILFWQLPFEAGELKVVGYNKGKAVAEYALNTHGKLASIELVPTKTELEADHYDVSHVHVRLLDENGNTVLTTSNRVKFELSGPAELIAVDNGWENSVQDETADFILPFNGRALAILQSTKEKGEITLTAYMDGAKKASVTLTSK